MGMKAYMKKIMPIIVSIILIILFTISVVPKSFQNDTFFTLAIGEAIASNKDVDTLTMHENIHFEHSGYFDIILYKIYTIWDFLGIYVFVLFFACIQAILFYFIVKYKTNNKILSLIFTIIVLFFAKNEFAARAQVISFTLYLVEFYCIEKLLDTNKKRYFVILLVIPILIANLHSSVFPMYFVFYLPYIAEFILGKLKFREDEYSKMIIQNREIKKIIILIIFGILAGFCTPTGLSPFTDMFKAMMSKGAVATISELNPINITNSLDYVMFIFISIAILAFTKTKLRITDAFYILGFSLMALFTVRCVFYFYLYATPCIARLINDFFNNYNVKIDINKNIEKIKYSAEILGCLCLLTYSINGIVKNINCEYVPMNLYPSYAVNYILKNVDIENMNIYNHFNFGSYLEFKGIPVFIDSRSGIYTQEFNEGVTVLDDFIKISTGRMYYKDVFDKYKITHVLLYNEEIINQYIFYDDEWNLLYKDDGFSLYERVK